MARNQPVFICSSCGGEALKWQGQCPHCAAGNTLSRLSGIRPAAGGPSIAVPPGLAVALASDPAPEGRLSLGAAELDPVFGGGLGPGPPGLLGGGAGVRK